MPAGEDIQVQIASHSQYIDLQLEQLSFVESMF